VELGGIADFRRGVFEAFALRWCYTA